MVIVLSIQPLKIPEFVTVQKKKLRAFSSIPPGNPAASELYIQSYICESQLGGVLDL